jgi:hypothetical protein
MFSVLFDQYIVYSEYHLGGELCAYYFLRVFLRFA